MPSPFPGMDPFLEFPARWPSVHHRLITYLADDLTQMLPMKYVADIGERVFVANPSKDMYPDLLVVKSRRPRKTPRKKSGGVLLCDPPLVIEFPEGEIREAFIEVSLAEKPGTLVAVVEILSPTNKRAGQEGRLKYLEKQKQILNSSTHLAEIDLLRAGEHTVAVPAEHMPDEPWDYVVCVHRAGSGNRFDTWPVPLPERLPCFALPLLEGDADLVIDLQSLLNRCYKAADYGARLDYQQACPPPLTKEQTEWIDQVLRRKKLRK